MAAAVLSWSECTFATDLDRPGLGEMPDRSTTFTAGARAIVVVVAMAAIASGIVGLGAVAVGPAASALAAGSDRIVAGLRLGTFTAAGEGTIAVGAVASRKWSIGV